MLKNCTIMSWNKGNATLGNKIEEIEVIIEKWKPAMFCVLEANLEVDSYLNAVQIEGYSLEKDKLAENGFKCRTVIYISNSVEYSRRKDLEPSCSPVIWIELFPKSAKSCLIFSGYREFRRLQDKDKVISKSTEQQLFRLDEWDKSWNKASQERKPLVLLGDFNIDITAWINTDNNETAYQKSKKTLLDKFKQMTAFHTLTILKAGAT